MRTAVLLPNPSASRFTGAAYRSVLATLSHDFDVRPEWADGPKEIELLARAAADAGTDVVVAMGGDGVVHHVANGLVGTDTALGVIPAGTTNVVAKIIGMPHAAPKAAAALGGCMESTQPLARVATETTSGEAVRHAVFAFGIGFDADVVETAEKRPYSKLNFGSLHYARSTAAQVLGPYRSRRPGLTVRASGETAAAVAVMVQILHPYTYFGRIRLQITREPTAGLTALAIHRLTPWKAIGLARRAVIGGTLEGAPGCTIFEDFDRLDVVASPDALHQADGEPLGSGSAFSVTPAADALKVLVPPPG